MDLLTIVAGGVPTVVSIVGTIMTRAAKAEAKAARSDLELVRQELRGDLEQAAEGQKTMREEFGRNLAEAENRFFARVNGNYVRKELHVEMDKRVNRLEDRRP